MASVRAGEDGLAIETGEADEGADEIEFVNEVGDDAVASVNEIAGGETVGEETTAFGGSTAANAIFVINTGTKHITLLNAPAGRSAGF